MRRVRVVMSALIILAIVASPSGHIVPRDKIGVSNVETAKVELPASFGIAQARTLRMRKITIAPGGALPMHSHADRPSVSYVLSGELTEYVAGETSPRVIRAEQSNESFLRDHALENLGNVPVVFLEIDLPKN